MSLEIHTPRRPPQPDRDKPEVDRTEHANLERARARLHPCAPHGPAALGDWRRHAVGPRAWK